MDDRFAICNMAIEAGGKNGIFPVDEKTLEYIKAHSNKEYHIYEADEDAEYDRVIEIDLSTLKSTVAFPHLPENTHESVALRRLVLIRRSSAPAPTADFPILRWLQRLPEEERLRKMFVVS